jgi:hypothetical protein
MKLSFYERELLSEALIASVTEATSIRPCPELVEISRDKKFQICLKMSGKNATGLDIQQDENQKKELGKILYGDRIIGETGTLGGKVTIDGVFLGSRTIDGISLDFKMDGIASKITYEPYAFLPANTYNTEVHRVIEYCLSGPQIPLLQSVGLEKEASESAKIKWNIIQSNFPDFWQFHFGDSNTPNHSYIGNDGLFFKTANEELLMDFSNKNTPSSKELNPISIHYSDKEKASDASYRKNVMETLSFIFGRKIIPLGVSYFNTDCARVRSESQSVYSPNLNLEIYGNTRPSWYDFRYDDLYKQSTANDLFRLFMDAYDKYELKDVMSDYWLARTFPKGPNLVQYASALEGLINNWYKVHRNEVRTQYVEDDKFEIIKPLIEKIGKKYPKDKNWGKIAAKIKSSNFCGIRDKHLAFFQALNMKWEEVEIKTMKSRSIYAHGSNHSSDPNKVILVHNLSNAYMTLFHRALLRIGFSFDPLSADKLTPQ